MAHAITRVLPHESITYFGDTAHLPYGDKSPKAIQQYSHQITKFLLAKKCKAIVIACNTASSHAYNYLYERFKNKVLIINVIDPVIDFIISDKNLKRIGVIGTKGTISSAIYSKKINDRNPQIKVNEVATSLLAPMIEEGIINCSLSNIIISEYLSKKSLQNIQALILACTHYPIIKKELEQFYNNKISVIDSSSIIADFTKQQLTRLDLQNKKTEFKPHHFFVSDYTPFFEATTKLFFKRKIHLELSPL